MTVELTTAHRDRPEQPVDLVAAELAAARLTRQVADHLAAELHPRGVGVVLQAEHACMTLRGVRAAGATTVTSALLGTLRTTRARARSSSRSPACPAERKRL